MNIRSTLIEGVSLVESKRFRDHRGGFQRLFCGSALKDILQSRQIVQVNHSHTEAVGTVRGLHYQCRPHAEMKLVRCLKGRVWDVAVDLRAGSATLLRWHAEELTAENGRMLVIPEGCAHGFQVLERDSELLYLHTSLYMPSAEAGICVTDPRLGIRWPLPVGGLSERDANLPLLSDDFSGVVA